MGPVSPPTPKPMDADILEQTTRLIEAAPHSGPALVLYALVMTLSSERGQYLFLLNKLKDLDAEHRQMAYRLMEFMVADGNRGPAWAAAVERMSAALRGEGR